ncbi:MAG: LPS-assembly protein LptD, partial [Verrucomicrobia bacterium]|nr:LPS-assembly protein LptD [Verrucomicrobiota bacterium]
MICRLFVLLSLVFLPVCLYAQANQSHSGSPLADLNPTEPGGKFSQSPVEITAEGQTRYEGGVAIAENHVVIHYGDVAIYCEYAEYNPETHDVLVKERVRLYRGDYAFVCDRAVYNLETKRLYMADFAGAKLPFEMTGSNLTSFNENEYKIYDGTFTTSDSSQPDYYIRAKGIRIYPNDRIIFTNAWVFVKDIPVFWFPYLYQSLNNQSVLLFSPGYNSTYGYYLVSDIGFPVFDHFDAIIHPNYYSLRGPALGIDINYDLGEVEQENTLKMKTFFIEDKGANINQTSLGREQVDAGRYRISFQSRTFLASDTSLVLDVNKFSDAYMLEDFFPYEFQVDPQPQTYLELIKQGDAYALSLFARYQVNDYLQTTEKLPELSWEVVRTPLLNSPIFYEATTTAGWNQLAQPVGTFFNPTLNPDYSSFRFDTFHQLSYPKMYFGFLSIVPRAGFRVTYYSRTGDVTEGDPSLGIPFGSVVYEPGGTRYVFNTGFDTSFKLSHIYEGVQAHWLGLDGLLHVIQPYADYSWVSTPNIGPGKVLPYDRYLTSTYLPPIDFPEFTATDSIAHLSVLRLGVLNKFETRRDSQTYQWLTVDTFLDVNFNNPFEQTYYSDIQEQVRFSPVPWLSLSEYAQIPWIDKKQFWEFNTTLTWTVSPNIDLTLLHSYLNHNPLEPKTNSTYL